jgi:hypothetical protein
MANFDTSAFDKEFDDYLDELEELADEALIARAEEAMAAWEAALDRAAEIAFDNFLAARREEPLDAADFDAFINYPRLCTCAGGEGVEIKHSEEKFVEFPF